MGADTEPSSGSEAKTASPIKELVVWADELARSEQPSSVDAVVAGDVDPEPYRLREKLEKDLILSPPQHSYIRGLLQHRRAEMERMDGQYDFLIRQALDSEQQRRYEEFKTATKQVQPRILLIPNVSVTAPDYSRWLKGQ